MFFPVLNQNLLLRGLIVAVAATVGIASYKYFNLPEDNTVEECAEYVIKAETGLDIDLSFTKA